MGGPHTPEALKAARREAGKVVDTVCFDKGWGFRDALIEVIAPLILLKDTALAAHQQVTAERDEARAENDRFRAGLANGSGPCAYCNLSREDWSKCRSGFPGCDRAADAVLCPHFGAEMEANDRADAATSELARLRAEGEALKAERDELWRESLAMRGSNQVAAADAVCDSYARENQRLFDRAAEAQAERDEARTLLATWEDADA